MTECHSSFPPHLPPSDMTSSLSDAFTKSSSDDQMSSFSATTEHSSPPYSHTGTEQLQYSTPESYNDQRTETPSSDHLNIDFAPTNGYSPDVATSSDRDESPDTISTSSGGAADILSETAELKSTIISPEDAQLQMKIIRSLQESAAAAAAASEKKQAPLNLLSAFNSSLLSEKLSESFHFGSNPSNNFPFSPKSDLPVFKSESATPSMVASVALGPTVNHTPEATPTKRKRQRRNPVWPYFDVIDGTARCKQCLYSTKSVFSTNLKVHLRSHHRADYEKVIQAEDALNLNALLLSGNSSKLFSSDPSRKRMPPMTSSILMTINKLASQNSEGNALDSVLRQTLAAGSLTQQLQHVQNQIQQQQQHQHQQQQKQQLTLNAANLAALNNINMASRNQMMAQQNAQNNLMNGMTAAEQFMSQFNFQQQPVKQELPMAPHGTDANGMPQPKRRRLRRHPVWMFFRDLEDRMVGCINCNFRTGSAFSTNLKMHLKAHHKDDYERVLKLEDNMRIEEGIFGPPNKMKSELIDFIRGGGNASTPPNNANPSFPKATPLVQQIISQTRPMAKKENVEEDPFNGMSMSDKLAALVGLAPPPGNVEGEISEEKQQQAVINGHQQQQQQHQQQQQQVMNQNAFDELRRAAERIVAANMGLQPPPQEQHMVNLNGSIMIQDNKSSSSASTDVCEDKKGDRDRALARTDIEAEPTTPRKVMRSHAARFWLEQGGNDDLLQSELFKALLNSAEEAQDTSTDCPVLEKMEPLEAEEPSAPAPTAGSLGVTALFDVGSLTYDGIFDALQSFERSLCLSEATACGVLVELLRNSANGQAERNLVETVVGSLERIAAMNSEEDRSERMRKMVSEKMKLKRLFETNEQREQRLERMRERYRNSRAESVGRRSRSSEGTPAPSGDDQKEEKLRRLREYQRRRLEKELPEQRERRLAKMRQNQKMRRERQNAQRAGEMGGIELLRALAPDYEMPEAHQLAALVEEEGSLTTVNMH